MTAISRAACWRWVGGACLLLLVPTAALAWQADSWAYDDTFYVKNVPAAHPTYHCVTQQYPKFVRVSAYDSAQNFQDTLAPVFYPYGTHDATHCSADCRTYTAKAGQAPGLHCVKDATTQKCVVARAVFDFPMGTAISACTFEDTATYSAGGTTIVARNRTVRVVGTGAAPRVQRVFGNNYGSGCPRYATTRVNNTGCVSTAPAPHYMSCSDMSGACLYEPAPENSICCVYSDGLCHRATRIAILPSFVGALSQRQERITTGYPSYPTATCTTDMQGYSNFILGDAADAQFQTFPPWNDAIAPTSVTPTSTPPPPPPSSASRVHMHMAGGLMLVVGMVVIATVLTRV